MPVVTLVKKPNDYGMMGHLGYGEMVFCFFSSVSYHLEGPGNWGKRFPRLLLDLCDHGMVETEHLEELKAELDIVFRELQKFSILDAVYDIGDLSRPIPWELLPGAEKHNLAQAWVTPRSEASYYDHFMNVIADAQRRNAPVLMIYPHETGNRNTLFQRKEKGREYWIRDIDAAAHVINPDEKKSPPATQKGKKGLKWLRAVFTRKK